MFQPIPLDTTPAHIAVTCRDRLLVLTAPDEGVDGVMPGPALGGQAADVIPGRGRLTRPQLLDDPGRLADQRRTGLAIVKLARREFRRHQRGAGGGGGR